MEYLVPAFFLIALAINARAVFKLSLDWKGMRTTVRFVREAYARLASLPTEEVLERIDPRVSPVPWPAGATCCSQNSR